MNTLVIVESPNKCASIRKYLNSDKKNTYTVLASVGHIRDLQKSGGIDIENDFKPNWENSPDKFDVIAGLKKAYKEADDLIIMTDADSEGSAIGYHICEVLGVNPKTVKRSIALEITEKAIREAVSKPGKLDMNVVEAAIGRRELDRLFGFKLSPVLWNKVKMGLSAGRVQSPALRIICTRELEHQAFIAEAEYKVVATFEIKDNKNKIQTFSAVLNKKFKTKKEAEDFLDKIKDKDFTIKSVEKKPGKKVAPAPFTTSAIQMECSRKFGMSPDRTMSTLQSLFAAGLTSYHRTDSTSLSEDILTEAEKIITDKFGKSYSNRKQFTTKNKSAEGAHEGIRPTHLENEKAGSSIDEQKVYELVYKRTVASQMSDAKIDNTVVTLETSGIKENFIARGQVITFDGFLKLYQETVEEKDGDENDSKALPDMKQGQNAVHIKVVAGQTYNKPAPRYSEAALIKELESLSIGRPSTYASILSVIQKRGYCEKTEVPSKKRDVITLTLENKKIDEVVRSENYGGDKNKLIPTSVGMLVNKFLCENFPLYVDYDFTAKMEESLDKICDGKLSRVQMLTDFYTPFIDAVKKNQNDGGGKIGVRELGIDPVSGMKVIARLGRFGPMIQLGEAVKQEKPKKGEKTKDDKEKSDIKFASIPKEMSIDTITLKEALELLKWPRNLGEHKKLPVEVSEGKFGPYVKWNSKFFSITLPKETITLEEAIEVIKLKEAGGGGKGALKEFDKGEIKVLDGKFGPYISYKKKNFKVPAQYEASKLTKDECLEIIGEAKSAPKKKFTKFTKKKK